MIKERESNIELLKCLAIFMIVFSHDLPRYVLGEGFCSFASTGYHIDVTTPSISINNLFAQFFTSFGQIGNAIFIICSSFFLCESKGFKRSKLYYLITCTFFISLLCYSICTLLGFSLGFRELFHSIFPLATGGNWFVICFIIFYMLHPLMNTIINSMSRRQHLFFLVIGLYAYSIWTMIFTNAYLFFPLVQFILIFFIVSYIKKYKGFKIKQTKTAATLNAIGWGGYFYIR